MPDRRDLPLRDTVIKDPSNILIWFRFTIQGGAFLIWGGALNILNCVISGNSGATGGGFHIIRGAINISNSVISSNSGNVGGGMFTSSRKTLLTSTLISGNSAISSGGGLYTESGLIVTDCVISGNSVSGLVKGRTNYLLSGGGIIVVGGIANITNSNILNNTVNNILNVDVKGGGGLALADGTINIRNCVISGNVAIDGNYQIDSHGGGFLIRGGVTRIIDCVISGNFAGNNAGGGSIYGNGGAFYISGGTISVRNSLISNNIAEHGAGFRIQGGTINVFNSVISGNIATSAYGGGFEIFGGILNVVKCHFDDNRPEDIYANVAIFLLNNRYNTTENAVKGTGNIVSCYPGICSEFNIGVEGFGCHALPNKLGNNCSICPPGFYLPEKATYSSCLACLPGQHAPRSGMGSCKSCSAGRYQNVKQGATCSMCPPGKFGNISLACIDVPRGSYPTDCLLANGRGCATTTLCPKGYYCNGTALRPVQCPPGRTTEFLGLATCSGCPVGKAGTNGTCQSCHGNSGTFEPGSTHCYRCPIGKFINAQKTFCALEQRLGSAPRIQFVQADGPQRLRVEWDASDFVRHKAQNASLFVIDKVRDQPVSSLLSIPITSPISTLSLPSTLASRVYQVRIEVHYTHGSSPLSTLGYPGNDWTVKNMCTDQQYLDDSGPKMTLWKCVDCPLGASCAGDINWGGVVAQFGYWRHRRTFYKCLNPAACMGAKNVEFADRYPTLNHDHAETCNTFLGFANYSRLCAQCKSGYVRGTARGSCDLCDATATVWELGLAGVLGTAVTLALVEVTVFRPRTFRVSNGVKKIALSYLQMATLATKVNVPWTKAFGRVFAAQAWATSIADAFLSIDCLLTTWSTWDVFQLKFGCLLLFPLLIAPLILVGVLCRRRKMDHTGKLPARKHFVSTMVLLLYLLYPALAKKVTDLFTCTGDIDGMAYLQLDPSVACWQGSHLAWVLSGGALGVLVYLLGLPLAGYLTLRGVNSLSDSTVRLQYGILYDGYRDQFWWWEMTVVWRKLLIIAIGALVEGTQQILTILLLVASLMFLTAVCQPFVNQQLLLLELMSLSLCFMTFWVGSMLVTDPHGGEGPGGTLAFGLAAWSVAVLNLIGGFALFYTFATSYWKEKGKSLMDWACGQALKICLRGKKRRESKIELLSELDYNAMDDEEHSSRLGLIQD